MFTNILTMANLFYNGYRNIEMLTFMNNNETSSRKHKKKMKKMKNKI